MESGSIVGGILKICSKCQQNLPMDKFWKRAQTPDGYDSYCTACRKISKAGCYHRLRCRSCRTIKTDADFDRDSTIPHKRTDYCRECRLIGVSIGLDRIYSIKKGYSVCSFCEEVRPNRSFGDVNTVETTIEATCTQCSEAKRQSESRRTANTQDDWVGHLGYDNNDD